ncbi:MAG: alpha/beta hydrolase, partial [Burkholderiaceae bacterium]
TLAAAARRGAALRPASRAALQPPARRAAAQVILLHGGLSSVRGAFAAALDGGGARTLRHGTRADRSFDGDADFREARSQDRRSARAPLRGEDVERARSRDRGPARAPLHGAEFQEAPSRDDGPARTPLLGIDVPGAPSHEGDALRARGAGIDATGALDTIAAWDAVAAGRGDSAAASRLALESTPSASRPLSPALRDAATRAAAAALIAAAERRDPAGREPPRALWPGLPELDARPAWRFEHDTFLGIERNVTRLVEAVRRECVDNAAPRASRHVVLVAHGRGGNVARFALPALRKAFGRRGWTFAAVTLGSPHLGTHAYARMGARWHALAAAAGGLRRLDAPGLDKARLAELVQLERALADALPQGFLDLEPAGILRLTRGRPATALPPGMWLVGSHWGPGAVPPDLAWDWLFEDAMGADDEGDGLVQRHSALAGRTATDACFDASPVFHTHYLAHEATRERVGRMLGQALEAWGGWPSA